ncbi:MAG: DUF533 domain-containing protein [Acidobacteria bacterium]|nr:DUF533 domain-containing protein [Acidobacteriota bacterium]
MFNNPADILSVVLRGAMGRSGRKRARRATKFLTGDGGFLTASSVLAAAGVAWGIYDSVKRQDLPQVPRGAMVAPIPVLPADLPNPVLQMIRLAVSASRADGELSALEREQILSRARAAGLEAIIEPELTQTSRPLAEIVQGITDPAAGKEFYTLAFTIVRADEVVTGGERIYLAQLAHRLGLDPATVAATEAETTAKIDASPDTE